MLRSLTTILIFAAAGLLAAALVGCAAQPGANDPGTAIASATQTLTSNTNAIGKELDAADKATPATAKAAVAPHIAAARTANDGNRNVAKQLGTAGAHAGKQAKENAKLRSDAGRAQAKALVWVMVVAILSVGIGIALVVTGSRPPAATGV
jgi:hypothetical protein